MHDVYIKFLQIIETLEPPLLKNLSPTALFLLNKIAVKDFMKQQLNVSQLMEFKSLGSPANLHLKLDELRHADLVLVTNIGTDRRTKYVFLTQIAKDYFQIYSNAMLQAVESK